MSSPLARLPFGTRRRLAATLMLFGTLFVAVGAVAATGRGTAAAPIFSAVALVVAVFLGLMAWGVQRSIGIDRDDSRLDAAIEEAMAAHGGHGAMCGCGVAHDPAELHITDACEHDGTGDVCEHDCATCVLSALRPSPSQPRSQRTG